MKKRIVSVLLVMAMCVSMSACGSKGAEKKFRWECFWSEKSCSCICR